METYNNNVEINQHIRLPFQIPLTFMTASTNISSRTDHEIKKPLEEKQRDDQWRFYKNKYNCLFKETNANWNPNVKKIVPKRKINDTIELEE